VGAAKLYLADGGEVTIASVTDAFSASVAGLTIREITLQGSVSTTVPGGCTTTISSLSASGAITVL